MEVSRNWRLQKQRYGLIGEVCVHCGQKLFPPRDVCPNCAEIMAQAMNGLTVDGQLPTPVVISSSNE